VTHSYFPTKSLLTDFYQFTMAQALFTNRRADCPAVFHIFFRQAPCNGHFALAAGIADALDYIRNFVIDSDSLSYLSNLKNPSGSNLFTPEFIKYLENLKPILDIHGIHDGEIIFAQEPMLRLEGPLALCMLLESPLLNIINYQTLIATKAARIKKAAGEKLVVDFGLRRAFGFDGAISATKAAYLGGLDATSNLWASNYFNIPHAGSQAHSFIMSYDSQEKAFESFAQAFPDTCILLTDTYDSDTGLNDAIKILKTLKPSVQGIRLDSGDLLTLSQKARFKLDKAGLSHCVIIASGDLDELSIEKLVSANAPIDIFGVGTKLVSAHNDRALGGVCKLASIFDQENWRDTYKLSNDSYKRTFSGRQAVKRYSYEKRYVFDYLYNPDKNNIFDTTQHSNFDDEKLITKFLMRRGDMLMASLTLEEAKIYAQNNLLCLEPHLLELCPYSAQNNYKIVVDGTLKAL
jgi:nicotinate phosphoribosyltransferase